MKRRRVRFEVLEARSLLSVGGGLKVVPDRGASAPPFPLTLAVDASSDPTGDGMVVQSHVRLDGQTAPHAVVRLLQGGQGSSRPSTRADARGHYHLDIRLAEGHDSLQVEATSASGQHATAGLSLDCGNQVVVWNAVALQAIRVDKTPPPLAARDLAMVESAVYGAVNSIVPTHAAYHVRVDAPRGASADAAAAQAAHDVLDVLFPAQASTFDTALASSMAGIRVGSRAKSEGAAVGQSAAQQILDWRGNDGSSASVSYAPSTAIGLWRPTPPGFAPALLPQWPQVTPFALKDGAQFRPPPPPAPGTAEATAALQQDQSLGASNSTTRTADQTQIALFWNDAAGTSTPPGHWNEIAEQVALQDRDSLVTDARLFALLDIAEADAGIAAWDAKYAYNYWRPVTAIQQTDPGWASFLTTPPFPSYVSGHSTFSAAASAVLTSFFGPDVTFTIGSDTLPGVTRTFPSFDAAAQEAGMSRIYGGIHYAFDNQAGLTLGQEIGQYVVQDVLTAPSGRKMSP